MFVPMEKMLEKARAEGYGITAPSVHNEDTIRAAIDAAVELKSPMILDLGFMENPNLFLITHIAKELAREVDVPIALNLDHGRTFDEIVMAIRAGFTSVMVDRSKLDFEENVREVAEIVRIAKACGVSVEAELGHVGMGEKYEVDRNAALTDPEKAREFVDRTGVDCLAVAIGTAHGLYHGAPYLDFKRLEELINAVGVPLVLHGGSGTGDENLAKAVRNGISKVNLGTDLYNGMVDEFMIQREKPFERGWMNSSIIRGYKNKLIHHMELFGQVGKA